MNVFKSGNAYCSRSIPFVYLLIVLAMFFWGLTYVWTSIVKAYYNPITIVTLRLSISTVFLFLLAWAFGQLKPIAKGDWRYFALSALFNPFIYFIGETYGVKYTSPTISAIFISSIPVFIPIMAYFFYKERLSIINVLGMLISFSGILFMIFSQEISTDAEPIGYVALTMAVLSSMGFSVLMYKLSLSYSAFMIVAFQNLLGLLYLLPLFFLLEWSDFISKPMPMEILYPIIKLAILGNALAFVFYTIANRVLGIGKAGFFINLIPIVTAIFAYFMVGEEMGTTKIIAIVVVLLGLFISQIKSGIIKINHKNQSSQ